MAPKDAPTIAVRSDALSGEKCIITGEIEGYTRKSAEQILIKAGATIEKSLNKKVTLVVLGAEAGAKKLEKVQQLGIETREWDELIEEIKEHGSAEPPADEGEPADDEDEDEDVDEEPEEKPQPKKKAAAPKAKAKANTKAKAAAPPPATKAASSSSGSGFLSGKKVIITGTIPGHDRKSAQSILEKEAGAQFAKSLNKQVELVILGTNPGPDKLSKIEELGIETLPWTEVAEKLGLEVAPEKEVAKVDAGAAPDSVDGMTLIITGEIDGHTRSSAQKILEGAGAKFAKSLNKSVELAVLGTNAGPDKLNKIADQGIATCSWADLITKLGIEAEASEPPKKRTKRG